MGTRSATRLETQDFVAPLQEVLSLIVAPPSRTTILPSALQTQSVFTLECREIVVPPSTGLRCHTVTISRLTVSSGHASDRDGGCCCALALAFDPSFHLVVINVSAS